MANKTKQNKVLGEAAATKIAKVPLKRHYVGVVVIITPFLPRGGGTARTAILVHVVNLIEIRLGERWKPISNQS